MRKWRGKKLEQKQKGGIIEEIIEAAFPNMLTLSMSRSQLRSNARLLHGWLKHLLKSV